MAQRTGLAVFIIVLGLCLLAPAFSNAGVGEEAKVQASTAVIKEIMEIPESAIPPSLLCSAHGIVIFPDLLKAGFIFGGRYGCGVLLVRNEDGTWSNPVFFSPHRRQLRVADRRPIHRCYPCAQKHSQSGCDKRRQIHSRG